MRNWDSCGGRHLSTTVPVSHVDPWETYIVHLCPKGYVIKRINTLRHTRGRHQAAESVTAHCVVVLVLFGV